MATLAEITAKEENEFRAKLRTFRDPSERMAAIGEEIACQLMWIRAALAEIDTTIDGK